MMLLTVTLIILFAMMCVSLGNIFGWAITQRKANQPWNWRVMLGYTSYNNWLSKDK